MERAGLHFERDKNNDAGKEKGREGFTSRDKDFVHLNPQPGIGLWLLETSNAILAEETASPSQVQVLIDRWNKIYGRQPLIDLCSAV